MLLVPKVAANMVNAHLANAICLTTRRSALRNNRPTEARGPRNIANAYLVNDWPTLREARRVQNLIMCSCPPPMTRMRGSASPRKRVLPSPVHSNSACSHLTWRAPPNCRNLRTKKNKTECKCDPKFGTEKCPQFRDVKWFQVVFILGMQYCSRGMTKTCPQNWNRFWHPKWEHHLAIGCSNCVRGECQKHVLKTGIASGTQNENIV